MLQPLRLARATGKATKSPPRLQSRSFHSTKPNPFFAEVMSSSSWFFHGIHDISGLPWAYSIPLTALLVRTVIPLPLQMYTKLQAYRERSTVPLLAAWGHLYRRRAQKLQQVARHGAGKPSSDRHGPLNLKAIAADVDRERRAMRRRLGIVRYWQALPFLQLPIWLSFMETIRMMAGRDTGPIQWVLSLAGVELDPASRVPVEPALATEGALWFPDLLAGDPTGALPALLAASILLNIHRGWKATPLSEMAELPVPALAKKLSIRGLRFFVQLLALNVGLASYAAEIPVALLLYWISSSSVATLQNWALDRVLDARKKNDPEHWKQVYLLFESPAARQAKKAQKEADVVR
ncbi:putative mitochondrial export translocase Oxa2 [Aspergillus homomorphus CBS 101889]|uniref:Putative mitochondrial export translocase Oxa2 n=1 Tax=Aspergillus homomorphus (strain CBS 101889) TaxID=1450537 RepID=A0A395HPF7_ASPHC|nr:putative mitochondrial export translocase Oxa2 [Aspergillus homomorphus CBS 101889]RAL09506.1 putative mitochondrial export translocase Oxa2 [Aspergillus homomorphus CBS 101889]